MYIYHVTNSGLLISSNGVKILIDGLFADNNFFNAMKDEIEEDILQSVGIFNGIDWLIFTHCHDDHFDGIKVRRFLKKNPATNVIVPKDALQISDFREFYYEKSDRIFILDNNERSFLLNESDLKLTFYKTKHLDYQPAECSSHYSLTLEEGDKRIFIAGDMELNDNAYESLFKNKCFSAVFFNPIVFYKKDWIENFLEIDAVKKLIYHLPSEENDRFYFRKMAKYHYNVLKNRLQNCQLLLHDMEKISL